MSALTRCFGDEADFRTLCAEAKKRGIYVMLDGVFNHTGRKSVYFNADGFYDDLGAAQGEQSPYYRWYNFHPSPTSTTPGGASRTLPAVNELEKSYVDYIIEGDHSIIKHWLRAGASGWRLDVADELPPTSSLPKFARAMNEENPTLISRRGLGGRHDEDRLLPAPQVPAGPRDERLMNYPFRTALMAYLLGGGAEYFRDSMEELRENYPAPAFYGAMNFLSTHDTPRLLTILGLTSPRRRRATSARSINSAIPTLRARHVAPQARGSDPLHPSPARRCSTTRRGRHAGL